MKKQLGVFFFFKWANFGPGRFYHWWVKVRKQKEWFIHLPHMYMIFTLKSIRNRTNLIQKFIWQYSLCFGIKIDLINDLTTNFSLSRSLNVKLNHIARTQKVRGQILKIEIAPKILRIYSDKFVNRICLIANTFQFEIMYICGT